MKCIEDSVPAAHQERAKKAVEENWMRADKDGNGELDMEELKASMDNKPPPKKEGDRPSHPSVEDIFKKCDKDESGEITQEEAMKCIDELVPEEDREHVK